MAVRNISLESAGPLVRDVMLREARTVPGATTLAEIVPELDNPRVRMILVADGQRYLGSVAPERLDPLISRSTALSQLADFDAPRVHPDDPVVVALQLLESSGSDRLPVVTAEDQLVGLVCFNRRRGHFCVDAERPSI
ncbi:MAG: CBS domain-containing protein [Actinomycetota bacterium]|nr:CBS domain-containing protein [Actinomycetota bacterium]